MATVDELKQDLYKLKDAFFYAITRGIDLQDYFICNPYRFSYALSSVVSSLENHISDGIPNLNFVEAQINQLFTEYRTDAGWLLMFQAVPSAPPVPAGIYSTQKSG